MWQDLGNVLHPIVQHKLLEAKQMVVAGGEGSTIIDADGTEYLDAMAGLWCVNIGYGRTELAEVAAEQMRQLLYFPHTAMNAPAAALAEKINALAFMHLTDRQRPGRTSLTGRRLGLAREPRSAILLGMAEKPALKPDDDTDSDEEVARRMDAIVRAMISMKPKLHRDHPVGPKKIKTKGKELKNERDNIGHGHQRPNFRRKMSVL